MSKFSLIQKSNNQKHGIRLFAVFKIKSKMSTLIETVYQYPWTSFWIFIGILVIIDEIKSK